MGLETSAVNLEGVGSLQKNRNVQRTQTEKTGDNFQNVFKSVYQGSAESMDSIFEEAAARYNISVDLLKAVAKAESNFNTKAVSKAGAMGVMQLMPATAKGLGVTDPFDARQNIMGGAKYLKENLDRFGGNVSLALAAYNAGPNSVKKYGGIPPYKETQNYVKTVTSYMNGSPIYAGKMVNTNGYGSLYGGLYGNYGSSYGLTSDQLLSLYGISAGSVGGMYGTSSALSSGSTYGLGSQSLMGLYGLGSGGFGGYGAASAISNMVMSSASASEDGETITMDKDSFASLMEILRLQMMMNASREIGSFSL